MPGGPGLPSPRASDLGHEVGSAPSDSAPGAESLGFVAATLTETTGIRYARAADYEWDAAKAARNRQKHGIDFTDAIGAVEDPNRLEDGDDSDLGGEERIRVIGATHGGVLFVVTTMRGEDLCRIISARRATRHEEDRYYAGELDAW